MFSDLRAKLEVAIEKVLHAVRLANTLSRHHHGHTDDNDDDNSSSVTISDNEEVRTKNFPFIKKNSILLQDDYDPSTIILAVRQDFVPALRALLEHGLYEVSQEMFLS